MTKEILQKEIEELRIKFEKDIHHQSNALFVTLRTLEGAPNYMERAWIFYATLHWILVYTNYEDTSMTRSDVELFNEYYREHLSKLDDREFIEKVESLMC